MKKTLPSVLLLVLSVAAMFSDPIASFRLTLSVFAFLGCVVFLFRREPLFFGINLASCVLLFFPIASSTFFWPSPVERNKIVIMQQTMETFSDDFLRMREKIRENKADIAVFSIGTLKEDMLLLLADGLYKNRYIFENKRVGKVVVFMNKTPEAVRRLKINDDVEIGLDFTFTEKDEKYHILVTKMPDLMQKGGYQRSKIAIERLMEYIHRQDEPFILVGDFTLPPYTRLMKPLRKEGFMTLLSPKLKLTYRLSGGETYVHPGLALAKVKRGIRIGENLPKLSVVNFNFETEGKEGTLAEIENKEGQEE